jgi:putative transposase
MEPVASCEQLAPMPRAPRPVRRNGLYHAYNRAELGQPIFGSDAAKDVFVRTLFECVLRFEWVLHAYAVMTNHFHIVVATPQGNLPEGMHWLLSAFANKHKQHRGTIGHVFQSRYRAEHYLQGPVAAQKVDYVHLNPVRAGIIPFEHLNEYLWTSYRRLRRPSERGPVALGLALGTLYGLRDDSAGWDAYEARLRLVLVSDDRALTEDELYSLIRKDRRGALPEVQGVPPVEEKCRDELRTDEQARWEEALATVLSESGTTPEALESSGRSSETKVALARALRSRCRASSAWIAGRLGMGSASNVRRLLND